jgi:hypothetical protein
MFGFRNTRGKRRATGVSEPLVPSRPPMLLSLTVALRAQQHMHTISYDSTHASPRSTEKVLPAQQHVKEVRRTCRGPHRLLHCCCDTAATKLPQQLTLQQRRRRARGSGLNQHHHPLPDLAATFRMFSESSMRTLRDTDVAAGEGEGEVGMRRRRHSAGRFRAAGLKSEGPSPNPTPAPNSRIVNRKERETR